MASLSINCSLIRVWLQKQNQVAMTNPIQTKGLKLQPINSMVTKFTELLMTKIPSSIVMIIIQDASCTHRKELLNMLVATSILQIDSHQIETTHRCLGTQTDKILTSQLRRWVHLLKADTEIWINKIQIGTRIIYEQIRVPDWMIQIRLFN